MAFLTRWADLGAAVDNGDDEMAIAFIQRKDDLVTNLETLTVRLNQAKDDVEVAKSAVQMSKENFETLTREKTQAIAELQVAQAKIAVQNANSAFSEDPTARGLTSVRESIGRLESRADSGYLDSEGHSMRGRIEAFEERSAEERARAELNRLKAAHGTPKPSDDDVGNDVEDEGDDSSKKRSL